MDATAQVAEVLEGLEATTTLCGEVCQRRGEQVAEGLAVASSHASAHLVEVGESEAVCSVDDDGVGIGDIDAVLHDGGGQQYVVVVVGEVEDDLFEFLGFHLSMTYCHTGIRDVFEYHLLQARQVADARIDKVDLSVA